MANINFMKILSVRYAYTECIGLVCMDSNEIDYWYCDMLYSLIWSLMWYHYYILIVNRTGAGSESLVAFDIISFEKCCCRKYRKIRCDIIDGINITIQQMYHAQMIFIRVCCVYIWCHMLY